jgi:hypothetical protein
VWYDHLPYIPFPENWPVFSPKDKIGDWLEMYTNVMEIPYWTSTTVDSASYDEADEEWTVEVTRDGEPLTLRPKHLVLRGDLVDVGEDRVREIAEHRRRKPGSNAGVGDAAPCHTCAHSIRGLQRVEAPPLAQLAGPELDVDLAARRPRAVRILDEVGEVAQRLLDAKPDAAAEGPLERARVIGDFGGYRGKDLVAERGQLGPDDRRDL